MLNASVTCTTVCMFS